MNQMRFDRVMDSLFPLIFCGIVFSIIKNTFSISLFETYMFSSFPAGWYFLSMRKKNQMRQMTDTDIIVREIRRVKVDPFYELVFWLIGKVIKIVVSIVIGFIFVPYYVFKVVYGLYKIINSKIMKQDKSQGEDM